MKKISSKIFAIIAGCSCLAIIFLGTISLSNSSRIAKQNAQEMLTWMARDYASQFSSEFRLIEDKVATLEQYVRNTVNIEELRSKPEYLASYSDELAEYFKQYAQECTDGKAAWCYFNPELSETAQDIYFVDQDGDGIPERQPHIPLSYFDNTPLPDDDKQWWYGPVNTKEGFWTNPYEWKLGNGEVIAVVSYAVPIYVEDELIAVVGTYYHFDAMNQQILDIKVYDTGYAMLFNEKLDTVVHPTYFAGTRFTSDNLKTVENGRYQEVAKEIDKNKYGIMAYQAQNDKKSMFAYSKLSNGWVLAVNPPLNEIYRGAYILLLQLVGGMIICMICAVSAAWFMGRVVTKPIMKVVAGAREVGLGNLQVEIQVDTKDELQIVAQSLNEMVHNTADLQEQLTRLAYYDDLTGGYNLHKFKQRATEFLKKESESKRYLCWIDINGFRLINDMFGFEDGDCVLKNVYKTLLETLNEDELFARIANDDFIVLLTRKDDKEIEALGNRFEKNFAEKQMAMGKRHRIHFTFGICQFGSKEGDISLLLDRCHMAHKAAKQQRQGTRYAFYDEKIRDEALHIKEIEDAMQEALTDGEFVAYLQPKFDLTTRTIKGAEALIRWIKEGRVIPPGVFIPIFESNGFVREIDLFVLEETCKIQRMRLNRGCLVVPISVNQSKLLLFSEGYIDRICEIVDRYEIPHHLIELEILETLIHYDINLLCQTVGSLRQLGFPVCIDDFGSGYSSLNMLKDIQVDILKIDREFLTQSEDSERSELVFTNVIRLARDLQMDIVVEGVETEKQVQMLLHLGCDVAQGYLYAKPMPLEEFNQRY